MEPKKRRQAETIFLILASLFITSLVTSNLIFQKFFSWNPFGWYHFELSVGIIAYPITFLLRISSQKFTVPNVRIRWL